jgi:methyl-accepting chemotaxis protein
MALRRNAVEELRHSVIKVVRTSAAEVDRRQTRRQGIDLPAHLSVAGYGEHAARVVDLSEGGARVRGAPELSPGTRGTLRLDGVAVPLPCVVRGAEGDVLHLAFELDEAAAAALRATIERLTLRQAA